MFLISRNSLKPLSKLFLSRKLLEVRGLKTFLKRSPPCLASLEYLILDGSSKHKKRTFTYYAIKRGMGGGSNWWQMLTVNWTQKQSPDVFYEKGVLKTLAKFTGPVKLSWCCGVSHSYFPVNVAAILRTSFLQNISDGCFYEREWEDL